MFLEMITSEPNNRKQRPPILFVHGVYHSAWCWREFLPYFAGHGYSCYAMSLRGHGSSDGSDTLRQTRFTDYLEDVQHAIQQIGSQPILVGHSLGGMLIRKYIETQSVPAAILISTPTPKSLLAGSFKLMRSFPRQMLKMALTMNPDHVYKDPQIVRRLFFSDNLPEDQLNEAVSRLLQQDESRRLFADVLFVRFFKPQQNIPLLVIGGTEDFGVHEAAFRETAAFYDTQPDIIPNMPHDMMLTDNWQLVASRILAWLTEHNL